RTGPARVTRCAITGPSGSTKDPQPYAIASGSDGAMWFTDPSTNGIGRATLDGSSVVEGRYDIGEYSPRGIVSAPDGSLWVALTSGPAALLRIDPSTGESSVVPIAGATTGIQHVAVASDGTLWVTQGTYAMHIRPDGSTIEKVPYPKGVSISDTAITVAPDGDVWVADLEGSALFQITAS